MGENTTNTNIGGQMASGENSKIEGDNIVTFGAGELPRVNLPRNESGANSGTTNTNIGGQMITGAGGSITGANKVTFGSPLPSEAPKKTVKVLFALSNPHGTDSLRLNTEMRAIEEALRLSQHRDNIQHRMLPAATANDLRRALLEQPSYQIVHLSGHGNSTGFVLEDDQGQRHVVSSEALAQHFHLYRGTLQCVLLNACYSVTIGQRIPLGIPYVIAMSGPISDRAAIEFSRGFYDAIGAGLDIERAYFEGLSAVRIAGVDQRFLALLLPG